MSAPLKRGSVTSLPSFGVGSDNASRGPIGPRGPVGPTGPAGVDGAAGAAGASGAAGAAGAAGATGATGPQGPAGGASTVVAAEDLTAFSVVTSTGEIADSGTIAHIGKIIGINPALIATGFSGDVTSIGEVENLSWTWVAGDRLFLNGTSLSTTPPGSGFIYLVGTAKNSTTIYVAPSISVLL